MKKAIIILLLVISVSSYGQKADTTKPQLTDTTSIFSVSDLIRLSEPYKDQVTFNQFQSFILILNKVIADRVKEWELKNKKK
jgi:hypothetical protein